MIVIRRKWGKAHKFVVMFKPSEFAPVTTQQERDRLFEDFKRWGVMLTSLADALGVHCDRVRGWKNRPQYRIPDRYWYQLVHVHKAVFAHLLENSYIDNTGNVLPRWRINPRKRKEKSDE